MVIEQIEKDLHRSIPDIPAYQKGGVGIPKLRNVLQVYAAHNPSIGYCQSMNIITAALLLFMEEEQAFYLLSAIIEKIPEYYVQDMLGMTVLKYMNVFYFMDSISVIGSIVDIKIFTELLTEKVPELMEHLTSISVDLSMICTDIFFCSFLQN